MYQQAYGVCESWGHVCWHRHGGIGEVGGQGVGEPWAGEKRRGKSWPAGGSKIGVEVGCKRRLTKMVVFEMGFRGACAGRWGYSGVGWGKGDVCEGCVPPPNCSERFGFGPFGTIHIIHPQPTYSTLHDVSENFQHPNSFFLWYPPLAAKKRGGMGGGNGYSCTYKCPGGDPLDPPAAPRPWPLKVGRWGPRVAHRESAREGSTGHIPSPPRGK